MSRKIPDFGEESYTIPYKNFKKTKNDLEFVSELDLTDKEFGKYNIYLAEFGTLILLFAVREGSDVPSAYVEFGPIDNNGIRMFNVTTMRFSPSIMGDIIKKILLQNYDFIISDNYHTRSGFRMYSRLLEDPDILFFVHNENTNDVVEIKTKEELEKYYGDEEDMEDWVFVVKFN